MQLATLRRVARELGLREKGDRNDQGLRSDSYQRLVDLLATNLRDGGSKATVPDAARAIVASALLAGQQVSVVTIICASKYVGQTR